VKSALIGALAALIAVGIWAQAVSSAPPPKRTLRVVYGSLDNVQPGKSASAVVGCPSGTEAIDGGWGVKQASFFYPMTSGIAQGGTGYVFSVFVPNRLSAPGSVPASFRLRALCAVEGKPIVP
jgi:hypothetical protein